MTEPVRWNIHPGNGTWISCYVWDTLEEMRDFVAAHQPDWGEETVACYLGGDWKFRVDEDREKLVSRKLGELHFANGEFGAGIFAHELQHFLTNWWELFNWDGEKNFEDIAYLAGDLTTEFWNNFYDHFELPAVEVA